MSSALGNALPRNIVVVPFVYGDNCEGGLEIGSSHTLTEEKITFLENLMEFIGISLYTLKNRKMLETLLSETQQQAYTLQDQQNQLQRQNQELEDSTRDLQASEELLRDQQAELKATNEELEDKTDYLQKQKDEIEKSNKDLFDARAELESKADALEESSRYKSEFLANMSHELRTPLNSMLILSKNLGKNKTGNMTDKQVRHAETIHKGGNDLLDLINDILDLSKVEAGKMDVNIMKTAIRDIAYECERTFRHVTDEKGVTFRINIDNDVPTYTFTDQQKINQILKNFLSNSIKFTEKGEVCLNIKSIIYENVDCISFDVTDTGIGIPEEKLSTIFEAFQQADGSTSRKYGGTGLGLSISREFIKLLNGHLEVKSVLGEGATFSAIIPSDRTVVVDTDIPEKKKESLHKEDVTPIVENINLIEVNRGVDSENEKEKNLLIIEDDREFAGILCEIITDKGYKCIHAYDGAEGIDLCKNEIPDAVLLDLNLPKVNGVDVLETLKKDPQTRHIPIHIMSANDVDNAVFEKGALGYLSKPISEEDIDIAFGKIEELSSRVVKELLIIESGENVTHSVKKLFESSTINTTICKTGREALTTLALKKFDCMIIDLNLSDITGMELIENIKSNTINKDLPIVVYTNEELRKDEKDYLNQYISSVVIQSSNSEERLIDDVTLFMHTLKEDLIEKKHRDLENNQNHGENLAGKKVLIVDDDVRNIYALSEELEEIGMKVLKAFNGKEALSIIEGDNTIDIVLMDIMMPEMNGYEAMAEIRKNDTKLKLPIIALTAKAMKEDKEKCIASGANEYLTKPVDTDKLLSCIDVWI